MVRLGLGDGNSPVGSRTSGFRDEVPQLLEIFMTALCNRAEHNIFALWFLSFFLLLRLLLSLFSSPNLSGRRLDVYHTSTHGVALVRI